MAKAGFTFQGADELKARLRAIQGAFVPIAKAWGEDASAEAKHLVHSPRGRIRNSIRPGPYNSRESQLFADYRAIFIDRGTVAHDIPVKKARVLTRGYPPRSERTVFGRKSHNPGMRPRPFINEAAERALERNPMSDKVIGLWNAAGGQARLNLGGGVSQDIK